MVSQEETLFEVETPPVRVPTRKATEAAARPTWSTYHTQRGAKCDDCMLVLAEAQGEGPASRPARWRRVQGGSDLLLCYAHGRARRVEDGLEDGAE